MFKSTGTTSNATTYLDITDRLFDKQNNPHAFTFSINVFDVTGYRDTHAIFISDCYNHRTIEVKYFCYSLNILEFLMQYMPGIQKVI